MTRLSRRRFLWTTTIAMAAFRPAVARAGARPSAREVAARASKYVARYDVEMAALVAEERYVQRLTRPDDEVLTRELISEIGWIRLAGLDDAIAVREVLRVDGGATAQRGRLRGLLAAPGGEVEASAAAMLDESAAHNLASGTLTINFPTFPLTYLRERYVDRSRWRLTGTGSMRSLLVLQFRERGRPTVVRTPSGEHLRGRGHYWIDEATGRVERCEVRVDGAGLLPPPRPSIPVSVSYDSAVTFWRDAGLGLWVPREMSDAFERRHGRFTERVTGEATYSNYRRFTTGGRLVSPVP